MTAQRDCHDCRSFVYCAEHQRRVDVGANPAPDAALRKLDALQAMHDAFVAEMAVSTLTAKLSARRPSASAMSAPPVSTELQRVIDTTPKTARWFVVKAGENGEVEMWE